MMARSIKDDIRQGLKKLKSQVYYDKSNTNLHLRKQLVTYLHQTDKEELIDSVYNLVRGKKKLDSYLEDIDYIVIPKRVKKFDDSKQFITNYKPESETKIEDINLIIDAPLEIHLLSVLWLMIIGYKIDKELPETCYGNRLLLTEEKDGIVSGRGLLKPYPRQYQKWRDDGIEITRFHLEQGNDVAFVNMDISSYYYNVRLNWDSLSYFVDERKSVKRLNNLLLKVHQRFTEKVLAEIPGKSNNREFLKGEVLLPIGLISSYTLANYYLKTFDKDVRKRVNPLYYGRYVDDIVIVLSNPKTSKVENIDEFEGIVQLYQHDHQLLALAEKLPVNIGFVVKNLSELFRVVKVKIIDSNGEITVKGRFRFQRNEFKLLEVQQRKIMIYEFRAGYSQSVIDKLQKDIEDRSSEFRQLPTKELLDFDKEVYELLYDDSFGKPRTLKDYKENRVGLSTYLYKATTLAIWKDGTVLKKEIEKVLYFFKGYSLINYYQHWEKLFTLLVVADRKKDLASLLQSIYDEIKSIELEKQFLSIKAALQQTLSDYVCTSLAQSFALKARILNDKWFSDRLESIYGEESNWIKKLSASTIAIRNIWFVRSAYVTYPLLEFTNWAQSEDPSTIRSLIEPELDWSSLKAESFRLANEHSPYPRFFNLYEVSHYL